MNGWHVNKTLDHEKIIQTKSVPLSLRESSWGLSAWMTRVSLSIQSSRSASLSADNITDFAPSVSCNSKQHFPLFGFWKIKKIIIRAKWKTYSKSKEYSISIFMCSILGKCLKLFSLIFRSTSMNLNITYPCNLRTEIHHYCSLRIMLPFIFVKFQQICAINFLSGSKLC